MDVDVCDGEDKAAPVIFGDVDTFGCQKFGPSAFEKTQVICVVDHSAGVGVFVVDLCL